MQDARDEAVSRVEVFGFLGWITSAVAYGELLGLHDVMTHCRGHAIIITAAHTTLAHCSAVPGLGLHPQRHSGGSWRDLLSQQVLGSGAAGVGERHGGVCLLGVREVSRLARDQLTWATELPALRACSSLPDLLPPLLLQSQYDGNALAPQCRGADTPARCALLQQQPHQRGAASSGNPASGGGSDAARAHEPTR